MPPDADECLRDAVDRLQAAKELLICATRKYEVGWEWAAKCRDVQAESRALLKRTDRWQAGLAKCVGQAAQTQGVGR